MRGKGGRIINTTSLSGLLGNIGQANYSAAKAGIYGFTRTLSMELSRYKITCNAIAPVVKLASALARKCTSAATSSGLPTRPIGIFATI